MSSTSGNRTPSKSGSDSESYDDRRDGISLIELEFNTIPDRNGWHKLYQEIREKCECEAALKSFSTTESEKTKNKGLNRYRDVNPYDHSRIFVRRGSVDYINANLVVHERAGRKYILTQGPLADTVGHFWAMVWEQESKAILMLNKLMEKKQVKCYQYWPNEVGPENALKMNELKLTVELLRCEIYKNYCKRWFKLTDLETQQNREIIQFHYTTWPDFGIPSSPVAFLQFLKHVRDSGALDPNVGPAVVHCSAGIGRSGTFCLVDCCLVLIEKEGENNVSVQDVLIELRRYRMGLIQTADQLFFSYQAIIQGMKLLNDESFHSNNETPIISGYDPHREDNFFVDETPPPLPPRTHSLLPLAGNGAGGSLTLNLFGNNTKPLPMIPVSESLNDGFYANIEDDSHKQKDALNNFINNEKNTDVITNRPLPPLPTGHRNSLDLVHESDSDNELYEENNAEAPDISTDRSSANDMMDVDTLDDEYENDDNGNTNDLETKNENAKRNANDEVPANLSNQNPKLTNGVDTEVYNVAPDAELKRRKRVEHQASLGRKVNEMKRKKLESDKMKEAANKKRSLAKYIAAGVIVGVICVYAYSKLA